MSVSWYSNFFFFKNQLIKKCVTFITNKDNKNWLKMQDLVKFNNKIKQSYKQQYSKEDKVSFAVVSAVYRPFLSITPGQTGYKH
jgi:hypothetical protein